MKKKVLVVFSTLLVLGLVTSLSYAYFGYSETQNTFEELGSKCFLLTMTKDEKGITINKAHPVTDEEGLEQEGYQFTIKNTCTSTAYYQVNIEDLKIEEKELSNQYIKASLNESKGKNINQYEKVATTIEGATESHKLTSGSLEPNKEVEYTLKLWMDNDTPAKEEVMNASYESKISIIASYIEEDKLENDITITYKEPDYYSKESETVEIRAESKNYKIIEYSIDGTTYEPVEEPAYEVTIEETYTEEKTYPIYFKDEMGNIKEENIETTKLDQSGPEGELKIQVETNNIRIEVINEIDKKSGIDYYEYQLNNDIWIKKSEKIYQYENLEEGMYEINVKIVDKVGNEVIKHATAEVRYLWNIEVLSLNSSIDGGKQITNLIKNGGYEEGSKDWDLSKATTATITTEEYYEGSHSLKISVGTAGSEQNISISSPQLNHEYYGSIMVKSPTGFTSGDSRYEFYYLDNENAGNMIFAYKNNVSKNNQWEKASGIKKITETTYLSENWKIRNFYVGASTESYTDNLLMVDLTETFGETIPTKEWLDEYLDYFDTTAGYLKKTIKSNESMNVTLTPENGYILEEVSCDHAEVEQKENTYIIKNPTADTVCKIKYKEEKLDLTILSETSIMDGGKQITNLIKNGGYEEGNKDWDLSKATTATITTEEYYEGSHSLKFLVGTATLEQNISISSPQLNHEYYGSIMVKSPTGFTSGDSRYEFYYLDKENAGNMIFAYKNNVSKNNQWEKASDIKKITETTYLSENWKIRNFYVGASTESYTDNLLMVDLTETFGETIPTKEWLDTHVNYFPTTATIYQDQVGKHKSYSIPITI